MSKFLAIAIFFIVYNVFFVILSTRNDHPGKMKKLGYTRISKSTWRRDLRMKKRKLEIICEELQDGKWRMKIDEYEKIFDDFDHLLYFIDDED